MFSALQVIIFRQSSDNQGLAVAGGITFLGGAPMKQAEVTENVQQSPKWLKNQSVKIP